MTGRIPAAEKRERPKTEGRNDQLGAMGPIERNDVRRKRGGTKRAGMTNWVTRTASGEL